MASYSELMAQAQTLMAQAEQARKNELASVIADIKAKMKQFGITTADLGGASGKKSGKSKSSAPAKYKGPNGELWARASKISASDLIPRSHRSLHRPVAEFKGPPRRALFMARFPT
jgi:DNA-binding protein H-NS